MLRILVVLLIASTSVVLVLVALELLLRYWAESPKQSATYEGHGEFGRSAYKLPFPHIASRDARVTEEFWRELQTYLATQKHAEKTSDGSGVALNRLAVETLHGQHFSIAGRMRSTTAQPVHSRRRITCHGGSTTFCFEVPDSQTWCSHLQHHLNLADPQGVRVENHGIGGTPGLERLASFKLIHVPRWSEVAVFYFGCNDSGWKQYGQRTGRAHAHLPLALRLILRFSKRGLEIASWIYGETSPRSLRKLAVETADTTIAAAKDAARFAEERGARVLFILQPHVFTRASRESWDSMVIRNTARDLSIMLDAAYTRYRDWILSSPIAVDATHIFDDEERSPYLDWAHVNSRGNELIAEFVYGELMKRGMLGPMPESTPS